ncbi:MAG: hypothetical protein LBT51_09170 [Fusobacteriaceae bacterium]|jgi:hypothetical protein|nr:hypothetical protein [Fusobacteriaceae bacterium]
MYLKKSTNSKTGRTYLSIVKSYRDKNSTYPKTYTIESLGYLDELIKKYDDPIAFFEKKIIDLNNKEKNPNDSKIITTYISEKLVPQYQYRKNFGYAALSKIYHELELNKFFIGNINNFVKLLVFSRLLAPASKKKTYEFKGIYFENMDFSLDNFYHSFFPISLRKNDIQTWLHKKITDKYKRNTKSGYFYITNYYFKMNNQDSLSRKNIQKENSRDPIIQMGIVIDNLGIPVSYQFFYKNSDPTTSIPIFADLKSKFNIEKIIMVADKKVENSENITYHKYDDDKGYIFNQLIRSDDKELKEYTLDEKDYVWIGNDYKKKSRLYKREIEVRGDGKGKPSKLYVDEKQVVFYSEKLAKHVKSERETIIKKAYKILRNPKKYDQITSYEASRYIKNIYFDKNTGKRIAVDNTLVFDEKKLNEDEKYDGYSVIITSECKKSDEEIIEIYEKIWEIKEAFKEIDNDLDTAPIYLSRDYYIYAHFLINFIALTIAKILQYRMKNEYSVHRIIESLSKISCSYFKEDYYLFDYLDDVGEKIGMELGIKFNKRFMKLEEIKKILGL